MCQVLFTKKLLTAKNSKEFLLFLQTALYVGRVEYLVSLVAVGRSEEFVVDHLDLRILVRLADRKLVCIGIVKNGCAESLKINVVANNCGLSGLTAAVPMTSPSSSRPSS